MTAPQRVLDALRCPEGTADLRLVEWGDLIRQARHARVLSRLAVLIEDSGAGGRLPDAVQVRLAATRPEAEQHARLVRWEVKRIQAALASTRTRIVLLKGAAFTLAELRAARGRVFSDVDILVPEPALSEVERALLAAGWMPVTLHPYDQRYYRQWMHELPPLKHRDRKTVVDVHHAILPRTARLRPSSELLLESVVDLEPGLAVLSPPDMVLHSATHLFADGDFEGGLRDLVDLDTLMRQFAEGRGSFWEELASRARLLGLGRPHFYALRYCRRLLHTPVPASAIERARRDAPPRPVLRLMDRLAIRTLTPPSCEEATTSKFARWLLYVRSHWLRMPPALLARHLGRKALRHWSRDSES